VTDGPEPVSCAAHPNVLTTLRCGKCGKPICPKCMVHTPVGARCPQCAGLKTLPTFRVFGRYYLRAAGVAVGLAAVIGALWGFIETVLPSYYFSLIIAAGIGWVMGELISLAVNRKRGVGLAIIGGAGVVLSYGIAFLINFVRSGFIVFSLFQIIFTLIAVGLGVYFAVSRLR
jgi:hypothetical protein